MPKGTMSYANPLNLSPFSINTYILPYCDAHKTMPRVKIYKSAPKKIFYQRHFAIFEDSYASLPEDGSTGNHTIPIVEALDVILEWGQCESHTQHVIYLEHGALYCVCEGKIPGYNRNLSFNDSDNAVSWRFIVAKARFGRARRAPLQGLLRCLISPRCVGCPACA